MDYVDVYSELQSAGDDIIRTPYSARYCGSVSPRVRISLHNVLILVLHTKFNTDGGVGFQGTFEFIPDDRFVVGTRARNEDCAFTVSSSQGKSGAIISPTYPGTYPMVR